MFYNIQKKFAYIKKTSNFATVVVKRYTLELKQHNLFVP